MRTLAKFLICFTSISASCLSAQSPDILKSSNIEELENFIKSANPNDIRVQILKPKLIALKKEKGIPISDNAFNPEEDEFKKLMSETSDQHTVKTVRLLNTMFDQDVNQKEAIILVKNNSNCNIIVRVQGSQIFNLPVPALGENTLVINKGSYKFSSNICDIKYTSEKNVNKNLLITLNRPVSQQSYQNGTASTASSIMSSSKAQK